jgi:hypothetical protein
MNLNGFNAPPGTYQLEIKFPNAMKCLKERHPHVVVRTDDVYSFEEVASLFWSVFNYLRLLFAKSLCPKLKGVLPVWRKLFGLGLQADSSTGERCSLRRHEPSSASLQAKAFGHQKMALESTPPPHNDGVTRRVSERIESCFRTQSEFL